VERLGDVNPQLRQNALDLINSEISIATSSMTSVPKPLKFLTPLYPKLKETYAANKLED
jgi:26S proteasome regulatory subunit N1